MNTTSENNGSLRFPRAHALFAAGAAALLLLAACGCGNSNHASRKREAVNSPEEARLKLAQLSVEYSPANFVLYAAKGDTTVTKLFLEAGIDVNSGVSDQGWRSTLLWAVRKTPCYAGGVSFNDFGPVTALEAARMGGHGEGTTLLLNHKAKVGKETLAAAAFLGDKASLSAVVAAWKTQPEAAKHDWTKEDTTGFAAIVSPKPEAVRTLLDVGYDAPSMLRLASTYFQINIVGLLLKRGGLSGNHIQGEIAYLEGLGELMKSAESIPEGDTQSNGLRQTILRELEVLKAEMELLKAELGDAQAQYKLGAIFFVGSLGVAKDEVEAVKWFRKAAEQNLADAQLNLGVCYANGQGVAKDELEAAKWYRKAAEQNLAGAQFNLGVCYANGQGVAKDAVEAVRWYRKAADQNLALAENSLGACYSNGQGVAKDQAEAVKWFRKAAEQKDAYAQKNLGVCYANGQGVAKDQAEAVKWYRKAAEQNDASAQCCLGGCYASGQGVAKDQAEAVKWFREAAEGGELYAVNALAWILATSQNSAIRDGTSAVVFGEKAVAATNRKDSAALDNLAAALAETGQFGKAVSTEKEAIALLRTQTEKNDYGIRLKLFEAKLPYRDKD